MRTIPLLQRRLARYGPIIAVSVACFICSWPSAFAASVQDQEESGREIRKLRARQRQLLEQVHRESMSLPGPSGACSNNPEQARQEARRAQLLRKLAEIERRVAKDGNGRTRLVLAGTKDPVIRGYYNVVKRRIEEEGTKNFPKEGNQSLHGSALIQFTI